MVSQFVTKLSRGESAYIIAIYLLSTLLILFSRFISPSFGSWSQIESILVISFLTVLIGFGQGLVILIGELDLSIGSTIALSGVLTTAWLGMEPTWTSFLSIVLILVIIGCVNGLGVTFLQIPSFIMTLATQMIIFGVALGYTKGTVLGGAPAVLEKLIAGRWAGIPIPIYLLVIIAIVGTVIQKQTKFGRSLYAIGSNRRTSYLAGLPVTALIILTYIVSSVCAGITGMIIVGYAGGATLAMGEAYLLPSIAMVVIGGTSILGGSGNYLGTIGAAILLTTISTLIQALGINQGWQTFIYGFMILGVLGLLRKELYVIFFKFRKGVSISTKASESGVSNEVKQT